LERRGKHFFARRPFVYLAHVRIYAEIPSFTALDRVQKKPQDLFLNSILVTVELKELKAPLLLSEASPVWVYASGGTEWT
jgi:hypothetical protein